MGTGGTRPLKRIIASTMIETSKSLVRSWIGRFAWVLNAVEKITAFESVDTRHGRSVLKELKETELPSYRRETVPFVRHPTKAATSNFVGVAHFARIRVIAIVLKSYGHRTNARKEKRNSHEKIYS